MRVRSEKIVRVPLAILVVDFETQTSVSWISNKHRHSVPAALPFLSPDCRPGLAEEREDCVAPKQMLRAADGQALQP